VIANHIKIATVFKMKTLSGKLVAKQDKNAKENGIENRNLTKSTISTNYA